MAHHTDMNDSANDTMKISAGTGRPKPPAPPVGGEDWHKPIGSSWSSGVLLRRLNDNLRRGVALVLYHVAWIRWFLNDRFRVIEDAHNDQDKALGRIEAKVDALTPTPPPSSEFGTAITAVRTRRQ